MNDEISGTRFKHPKENAGFLSKITFFYNLGIIADTYRDNAVKESHLFEVPKKFKARILGNKLDKYYEEQCVKEGKISLLSLLWRSYGRYYLIIGLIQALIRAFVIVAIPKTLSKIVLYFEPNQSELSKRDVCIQGGLLILLNFFSITYLHNYLLNLSELGIKIRTSICSLIYRKCLKLPPSDVATGQIITHLTKDVAAIENFFFYGNDTWIGVTSVIIVFCLIYYEMGRATLIGMGFFVAVLPVQMILARYTSLLRLKSCKRTEERLQETKQALSAICIVKMNQWEDIFKKKIINYRKKEMLTVLKIVLNKISVLLISTLSSKISLCLLLTSYVLFNNSITADLVYYLTTLFMRIRHALNTAIPIGITATAEMKASVKRIDQFLNTPEIKPKINTRYHTPRLELNNITLDLNNRNVIKDFSLSINSGLVVVTGCCGSGKTTLLKAILGEYNVDGVLVNGVVSYASQEAWIFPSSLKQNVLFGERLDEGRYQKVLDICGLNVDFECTNLEKSITDEGSNLSKGQKARINLARALYKKADIYLLDDPFSSLDVSVQKQIYQKCIKEFLINKIVILVTNNLYLIDNKVKIITINNKQETIEHKIEVTKTIYKEPEDIDEHSQLLNQKVKNHKSINDSKKEQLKVYKSYCKYGGGISIITIFFFIYTATQFTRSYTDKILSKWVNYIHQNSTQLPQKIHKEQLLIQYFGFNLLSAVLSVLSACILFNFSRKASLNLHKVMLKSVLNAPLKFFNTSILGKILNRFSKDLSVVDEEIPFVVYEFLEIAFGTVGVVTLISIVNPTLLIPISILFVTMYLIRSYYLPIGKNLQRLDVATRSHIITHLNSTLEGLTTIRAFGASPKLIAEFDGHQDLNTSASFTSKGCERAFGYYLDVLCTIFISSVVWTFILFDENQSVGDVGLGVTQAFMLSGIIQYGVRKCTEIENKMVSTKRILEYTNLEEEIYCNKRGSWPKSNDIQFKNVSFMYYNEYILKDINLGIMSNEKVGIVGRTGAGKSTLTSLIFNLYQYEGNILIGGVNLQDIPLKILRANISIVTQNPVLFNGSVRSNLDPEHQRTDKEIWDIIGELQMEDLIQSLDFKIVNSGSNFSVGQKQLICLIRCLLSKSRIVILDEATSDLDIRVDDVLKNYLINSTVLVVAHKLETVLSCDKIIVMDNGGIVEVGTVDSLKNDQNSIFCNMLKQSDLL